MIDDHNAPIPQLQNKYQQKNQESSALNEKLRQIQNAMEDIENKLQKCTIQPQTVLPFSHNNNAITGQILQASVQTSSRNNLPVKSEKEDEGQQKRRRTDDNSPNP